MHVCVLLDRSEQTHQPTAFASFTFLMWFEGEKVAGELLVALPVLNSEGRRMVQTITNPMNAVWLEIHPRYMNTTDTAAIEATCMESQNDQNGWQYNKPTACSSSSSTPRTRRR